MIIGVPKEIKPNESRVGMTPAVAGSLVESGHRLLMEQGAGEGSGFENAQYSEVGAEITDWDNLWKKSELVVKLKSLNQLSGR